VPPKIFFSCLSTSGFACRGPLALKMTFYSGGCKKLKIPLAALSFNHPPHGHSKSGMGATITIYYYLLLGQYVNTYVQKKSTGKSPPGHKKPQINPHPCTPIRHLFPFPPTKYSPSRSPPSGPVSLHRWSWGRSYHTRRNTHRATTGINITIINRTPTKIPMMLGADWRSRRCSEL